jgi:hypothetical protein
MKYLATCGVPVPEIYAWNSGLNETGAEYVVMEKECRDFHSPSLSQFGSCKVPGCSADSMWSTLSLLNKKKIVSQVARYFLAAFQAQFAQAGSVYLRIPCITWALLSPAHSLRLGMAFGRILNTCSSMLSTFEAHSAIQQISN